MILMIMRCYSIEYYIVIVDQALFPGLGKLKPCRKSVLRSYLIKEVHIRITAGAANVINEYAMLLDRVLHSNTRSSTVTRRSYSIEFDLIFRDCEAGVSRDQGGTSQDHGRYSI
jgi:hypothetical protein